MCSSDLSGFGQTGPYRERPAFDAVVQAMAGMMSITGEEDGPPARVGARSTLRACFCSARRWFRFIEPLLRRLTAADA